MRLAFRLMMGSLALTGLAIGCAAPAAVDDEDDAESTTDASEALTSTQTDGDWAALPTGLECVGGVRSFLRARFGAELPSMGTHASAGCAPSGACHIWTDALLDDAEWERIPNDGTTSPRLYDVIVYPPHGTNPYGHVALVDHIENEAAYVMDDNYVAHHQKSLRPHTVGRRADGSRSFAAYGWYRHR